MSISLFNTLDILGSEIDKTANKFIELIMDSRVDAAPKGYQNNLVCKVELRDVNLITKNMSRWCIKMYDHLRHIS
jgi:hypothetical protein